MKIYLTGGIVRAKIKKISVVYVRIFIIFVISVDGNFLVLYAKF